MLSPLTWNIIYDGVLGLQLPESATIIGFSDDIAVMVIAKHKEKVTEISDEAILIIQE